MIPCSNRLFRSKAVPLRQFIHRRSRLSGDVLRFGQIVQKLPNANRLSTLGNAGINTVEPPWYFMSGIGAAAGCFGAIVGLGGGVVIVPALVAFTKVPQKMAIGTSLVTALVIGGISSVSYASVGLVDIVNAACIAAGSALTARTGAQIAQSLPDTTLKRVLGVYMLLMAALVPARKLLLDSAWASRGKDDENEKMADISFWARKAVFFATGLLAGFASGMFGIAGGTIVTPTLAIFTSLSQPQVLGTSLTAGLIPTLISARSYHLGGNILIKSVPAITLGGAVGAALGSRIALLLSDDALRWSFSAGMTILGLRVLRTAKK